MTPTVPIVFFNGNALAVTVQVNGALTAFSINGTSSSIKWRPQSPFTNPVTFSPSGPPSANVLAPGPNSFAITPQGTTKAYTFTVTLSPSFQWTSIEIYIFFNTYATVSWLVLNSGQFVDGAAGPA